MRNTTLEGELKACQEHFRLFLENLADDNASQGKAYWKQQISGTFITYPRREVEELFQDFHTAQGKNASDLLSKAKTAYWILRLLEGLVIESGAEDKFVYEITTLYLALNKPWQLCPGLPTDTHSITISGNNVTHVAQAIIKIALLEFLVEHQSDIQKFKRLQKTQVENNYLALKNFNKKWLLGEIKSLKEQVKDCPLVGPKQPLSRPPSPSSSRNSIPLQQVLIEEDEPALNEADEDIFAPERGEEVRHPIEAPPPNQPARPTGSLWEQLINFSENKGFHLAHGGQQLFRSPVSTSSKLAKSFFWFLQWSYLTYACLGFFVLFFLLPVFAVNEVKKYIFRGNDRIHNFEDLVGMVGSFFVMSFLSPASFLMFAYGLLTLPIKLLEVGMVYVDFKLPHHQHFPKLRWLAHLSLLSLGGYAIFYPTLLPVSLGTLLYPSVAKLIAATTLASISLHSVITTSRCIIAICKGVWYCLNSLWQFSKYLSSFLLSRHTTQTPAARPTIPPEPTVLETRGQHSTDFPVPARQYRNMAFINTASLRPSSAINNHHYPTFLGTLPTLIDHRLVGFKRRLISQLNNFITQEQLRLPFYFHNNSELFFGMQLQSRFESTNALIRELNSEINRFQNGQSSNLIARPRLEELRDRLTFHLATFLTHPMGSLESRRHATELLKNAFNQEIDHFISITPNTQRRIYGHN